MSQVTLEEAIFFKKAFLFAMDYSGEGLLRFAKLLDGAPLHLKHGLLEAFRTTYGGPFSVLAQDIEPLTDYLPFLSSISEIMGKALEEPEDLRKTAAAVASAYLELEKISEEKLRELLQSCHDLLAV